MTAAESGYIDLHVHFLPGIDDGVRTVEEGLRLCQGLAAIGYAELVATPHIRAGRFENRRTDLTAAFDAFASEALAEDALPRIALAAEHYFDDVFAELWSKGESMPYPGARAVLVEFPYDAMPVRGAERLFALSVHGVRPVIAHPERTFPLFDQSDALRPMLDGGSVAQLDLMSLVGHYGRRPMQAAERMLDEGLYTIAASDCHRPEDVPRVAEAIERLRFLVGADADFLLREGPARLLAGTLVD